MIDAQAITLDYRAWCYIYWMPLAQRLKNTSGGQDLLDGCTY